MANNKISKADSPNKTQSKKRATHLASSTQNKYPKAPKKDNRKPKTKIDENMSPFKAAKNRQPLSFVEKKVYKLIVGSTLTANSVTVSQTSRGLVLYITSKESESMRAYSYIKNIHNSIYMLAQKKVHTSAYFGNLEFVLESHNIFVMTLSTFNMALIHCILKIEKFSTIFAMQNVLNPLKLLLQKYKPLQHSLPTIYITSNMILLVARPSIISLELESDTKHSIQNSSASLKKFNDSPFILNMQKTGLQLRKELGFWASELYFSHALNHLAELIDKNNSVSLVDGSLSTPHLEPCLLAANAVSKLHPGSKNFGISKKIRSVLDLLMCQSSMQQFRGVILTSCPLMAIYLKKVLGCFYPKHNTTIEVAVPRPEGYIGPLPTIDVALASYSNGEVQVLISTYDFIPKLEVKVVTWVVLFNDSLSVWSYMNLNLALSSVKTYYVFKTDQGRKEIIEFDRDYGDSIPYLRLPSWE